MNTPNDIENNVKQLLHRLDQAVQHADESSDVGLNPPEKLLSRPIVDLLPDTLFGVGMGFVMIFNAMLAIVVTASAYKVMFGFFATICLLTCAHKLDKVSRQFQTQRNSKSGKPVI